MRLLLVAVLALGLDRRADQRLLGAGPELDRRHRTIADEHAVARAEQRVHAVELVDVVEDVVDGGVALARARDRRAASRGAGRAQARHRLTPTSGEVTRDP